MKPAIDEVIARLKQELNIEYPLYEGQSLVSQDDLREIIDEVYKLRKTIRIMNARLLEVSWRGQVDHMSGAFDPNDRHEMGG